MNIVNGKIKTIEGFGLPGAGKSTCIAMLKNDPRLPESIGVYLRKGGGTRFLEVINPHSGKKAKKRSELYMCTSYLIKRPSLFLSVIQSVLIFRMNRSFLSTLRVLILALNARSKLKVSHGEDHKMLLDEGLIQYLGALVVNSSTNKQLPKKLIEHVLSNYILAMIYFDVDDKNAIMRIKKRNDGRSRFDRMNAENAGLNLSKMERTFTLCIDMALNMGIPVLKLENGNSVEDNIDLTLNFLNKFQLKQDHP